MTSSPHETEGSKRWNQSTSDYKLKFVNDSQKDEFSDLVKVITEDFRFSSDPELGLEAVDIITNTSERLN